MTIISRVSRHFNDDFTLYPRVEETDAIGQVKTTYPASSGTPFKGFIFLRKTPSEKFTPTLAELTESTHGIRTLVGPSVNVGDRLVGNDGTNYTIEGQRYVSGIGGVTDHLFLQVNIVENGNIQI